MKSTAKGSKTSHKQTDELARYIKELKARARLEKSLKKLQAKQKGGIDLPKPKPGAQNPR